MAALDPLTALNPFAGVPNSMLDVRTWRERHRLMTTLLVAQGIVLLAWSAASGQPSWHVVGHLLPIVAVGAAAASHRLSPRMRACAMAIGLFTESALAVHLAGGMVAVHFHYFVMLCLLAQYEDLPPLGIGVSYVLLQHGLLGTIAPSAVYGDTTAPHPWLWAALHGAFVLAASGALVANWRTNARVRARERNQRERVESYLRIADVLVVTLDLQGRVKVVNRKACEVLERPESELVGRDWFEVAVPAGDRRAGRRAFERMIDGETVAVPRYENHIVSATGELRLVEWHTTLVRDDAGKLSGTLSSGTDVTEQRAVMDQLALERRDLQLLRELAHQIASQDDARQAVVERAIGLADAQVACLFELDDEDGQLVVTRATRDDVVGWRLDVSDHELATVQAFRDNRPYFVADAVGHPAVHTKLRERSGLVSILYEPVLVEGRPAAVLVVGWTHRIASLGTRWTELVGTVAEEASLALQRLSSLRRLEVVALTDPLTGVANRRAFDRELVSAVERARESGRPLTLAFMDMNDFKAVNDAEGHAAGDRLLKAATASWRDELRPEDLLARLGGDEFAVLLSDCGHDQAPLVAARLREATPHPPGAAVGIAVWDGSETSAELLRRADRALYADKPDTQAALAAGRRATRDGARPAGA